MNSRQLEGAVVTGRIGLILDALEGTQEVRQKRWFLDALRRSLLHVDPGAITERDLTRLRAIGWPEAELLALTHAPPESAVHVPLVPLGDVGPFCRLMVTSYDPSGIRALRESYDAAARAAVDDGLQAAARALGRGLVDGFTFRPYITGTLSNIEVAGASLGAAAAVSSASLWSRRAVRAGTAVTGRIAGDRVAGVGGMLDKVEALAERPDIERLVVSTEDEPMARALLQERGYPVTTVGVSTVDELLDGCLEPEPRSSTDPERAVDEAQQSFAHGSEGWRWPVVVERLDRLAVEVPERRPDLRVRVLTMLGAAHRNCGDAAEGLELMMEALAILDTREGTIAIPDQARAFLHRHLATTLRQLCRFDEALDAALEAEACARRGRLRGDLAFALGTQGRVHLSLANGEAAVECHEEALLHLRRHDPRQLPQTGAHLIHALGHVGRLEEARARYAESLEWVWQLEEEPRRRAHEQWLRTRLAGALRGPSYAHEVHSLLAVPVVREAMEHAPLPGLLARRWLGLAEIELGRNRDGYARLAASPAAHPCARHPHLRFLAHVNVLYEGRARASAGELDEDAMARVRQAVAGLPRSEAMSWLLDEPVRAVLSALNETAGSADGSEAAVPTALDTLLTACARVE
jgi:tetratricopeptide (TPR) repeat protein